MRICFISRRFFPAISGMSVYATNYLREMTALGHEIVMISQYRNDPVGTGVYGGGPPPPVAGVEVIGRESLGEQEVNEQKPANFERDIEDIVEVGLAMHGQRPFDLIHAQYGYPPGLAALELSRRIGVPNVVSIQGGDGHWVGLCCETHQRAIRAVFNHANALIIGCPSFAHEVHENHGIPLERFTIIPGGINAEQFRPREIAAPSAAEGPPTLLYHGRVDRRKGVLELIEALDLLRTQGLQPNLLISGIGPDLSTARELVAEKAMESQVSFLGKIEYADVPEVYRRADIFVSPTWSEGFSNTILEAMASRLAIVASRSIGVVDCLRDDENGLLHDVHDVGGLAKAIRMVIEDPGLRMRLAETAFAEIKTRYQWPVVAGQIEEVCKRVRQSQPDDRWVSIYASDTTREQADPTCRFRSAPHLL